MQSYDSIETGLLRQLEQVRQLKASSNQVTPLTQATPSNNNLQSLQQIMTPEVQGQLSLMQVGASILAAIGRSLNEESQLWLSKNITQMPKFFESDEGIEIIEIIMESFKKSVEK